MSTSSGKIMQFDVYKREEALNKYWKNCMICESKIMPNQKIIVFERHQTRSDSTSIKTEVNYIKDNLIDPVTHLYHSAHLHESCFLLSAGETFKFWE
jgi:hypothetical protein